MSFFRSDLHNRQQRVQVQAKISGSKTVGEIGIPQGSILGLILSVIYMNEFPEHSDLGNDGMLKQKSQRNLLTNYKNLLIVPLTEYETIR